MKVGETFTVILTCALVNTDSISVLVDETRLDPDVMLWPPFDVLGGRHVSDLHTRDHRFFQYEYELRLITDTMFGKDVQLPGVPITYRLQTRVADGGLSEGLERTYLVAPQSVRVLSVVPDDATDIRDQSAATFADLESAALRARVKTTTGGVLMALAALLGVMAFARVATRSVAQRSPGPRALPARAVLRRVDRELNAVQRERETRGWTPDLAGRALTALRIAANYVLVLPTSQREAESEVEAIALEGALLLRAGLGGRHVLVSGSATPENVDRALARLAKSKRGSVNRAQRLVDLRNALTCLTQARYGREDQHVDAANDDSLASGQRLVRQLIREHLWFPTTLTSLVTHTTNLGRRLWSR